MPIALPLLPIINYLLAGTAAGILIQLYGQDAVREAQYWLYKAKQNGLNTISLIKDFIENQRAASPSMSEDTDIRRNRSQYLAAQSDATRVVQTTPILDTKTPSYQPVTKKELEEKLKESNDSINTLNSKNAELERRLAEADARALRAGQVAAAAKPPEDNNDKLKEEQKSEEKPNGNNTEPTPNRETPQSPNPLRDKRSWFKRFLWNKREDFAKYPWMSSVLNTGRAISAPFTVLGAINYGVPAAADFGIWSWNSLMSTPGKELHYMNIPMRGSAKGWIYQSNDSSSVATPTVPNNSSTKPDSVWLNSPTNLPEDYEIFDINEY